MVVRARAAIRTGVGATNDVLDPGVFERNKSYVIGTTAQLLANDTRIRAFTGLTGADANGALAVTGGSLQVVNGEIIFTTNDTFEGGEITFGYTAEFDTLSKRYSSASVSITTELAVADKIANGVFRAAFLTGDIYPWQQRTTSPVDYKAAMDTSFGAQNWDLFNSTTESVFDGRYDFVWLDGGDLQQAQWLTSYLNTYRSEIEQFVQDGGTVYINAARNQSYADLDLGFGVTLKNSFSGTVADTYSRYGTLTAAAANTVKMGPAGTTIDALTGNYFTHDEVVDRDGDLTVFITGTTNRSFTAVAGQEFGEGYAMFGGTTSAYWWSPDPFDNILESNIISYAASFAGDYALL